MGQSPTEGHGEETVFLIDEVISGARGLEIASREKRGRNRNDSSEPKRGEGGVGLRKNE